MSESNGVPQKDNPLPIIGFLVALAPPMMVFFGMIAVDSYFFPAAIMGAIGAAMMADAKKGEAAVSGAVGAVCACFVLIAVASQFYSLPKILWVAAMLIGYVPGAILFGMLAGGTQETRP